MVEPIMANDGLSSGSVSQYFNINVHLKWQSTWFIKRVYLIVRIVCVCVCVCVCIHAVCFYVFCMYVCLCADIVSEQAAFSGFSSLLPHSRNVGSSLGSTPG